MVGGRFLTDSDLQKYKLLQYEMEKQKLENDDLKFETDCLKKQIKSLEAIVATTKVENDKLQKAYTNLQYDFDRIQNEFDSRKKNMVVSENNIESKSAINSILQWED
ncbi:hypothetical protein [Lysinibacillus sp. IITD104]|uniref:hypothetical protein n=1 Tax=Lysinibacillus sp. IITD104 TaxID=3116650 RepID=UPI002FD2B36A